MSPVSIGPGVHIASTLANWALLHETRFVEGRAEVVAAVLEDGSERRWKNVAEPKSAPVAFDAGICEMWPWTYKLVAGASIWPPEPGPSASESTADGVGVTYTCRVIDDLIHCPRR